MRQSESLALHFVLCVSVLSGAGCSSTELTRSKARQIIDSSPEFSKPNQVVSYTLDGQEIQKGMAQDFWRRRETWGRGELVLTNSGSTFFVSALLDLGETKATVTLSPTSRRLVKEVTGIADAPALSGGSGAPNTLKMVEFTWDWDDKSFPPGLKAFLGKLGKPSPANGSAILRLYDDGWRLEHVR